MADNLESYFKKHLSDDTPAKDNWNVPSDDVWGKALPAINKKKGLFIPWKYLYIIGGLLFSALLVIFLWPTSTEEIDQTDQTSESLTENSSFLPEEKDQTNIKVLLPNSETEKTNSLSADGYDQTTYTSLNDNDYLINNDLSIDDEIAQTNQKDSSNGLSNKNQTIERDIALDNEQPGTQLAVNNNFTNFLENSKILASPNYSSFSNIEKLQGKTKSNISFTASLILPANNQSIIPPGIDKRAEKLDPVDNTGKFGIGAFFLPTFTTTYLSGDLNTGELETSNMYLYSNNWGLELKYILSNRFTLVTGIGQSEVRSWSKSQVDFDYDSSDEHIMDTGEKENTSAVPMPTPFGKIDTEITYRFPGEDDIPNGEVMQSELETHQEVRYLSIPLGVEFNIIRFSRFSWFVETGSRYNRALKDAASFTSRILHEGHDMDVVGEEMMGHPTYKESYLDLYLGAGINYQFTKYFQVSGSARYFNSITNVNLQDNMATHVRGFNIKIGLVYIF